MHYLSEKFAMADTLKKHKLTHTRVKNYECITYQKTFSWTGNLKIHELTYNGVKKYKCITCQKTFTEVGTLKKHILNLTVITIDKIDSLT